MSMKYLVIEGRAPQDGSTPQRALLLCPTWMSSTLVCAGIVGRIIELTDGNIVEERVLPYTGGEEELLAEIRGEFEAQDTQVLSDPPANQDTPGYAEPAEVTTEAGETYIQTLERQNAELTAANKNLTAAVEGFAGWQPPTPADALVNDDDSYRAGMQAERNVVMKAMSELGLPPDTRPMVWLKEQLTEKAQERRNLDAWRDAAGAAELCVEYAPDGMVQKIFTPQQSGGENQKARLEMLEGTWNAMGDLLTEYGITGRDDRLVWLQTKFSELEKLHCAVDRGDQEIERLRTLLKDIRKLAKKGKAQ